MPQILLMSKDGKHRSVVKLTKPQARALDAVAHGERVGAVTLTRLKRKRLVASNGRGKNAATYLTHRGERVLETFRSWDASTVEDWTSVGRPEGAATKLILAPRS